MKRNRRIMSLLLALVLLLGLVPMAFAADSQAQDAAEALYQLGLFHGTGKNADGSPKFDLDRAPTRAEAVTMLVRLHIIAASDSEEDQRLKEGVRDAVLPLLADASNQAKNAKEA